MKSGDYALLVAVIAAFATSIYLWFDGDREAGIFVGIWVPSILAFATYVRLTWRRK
jgi:hypothetical protein